jgi:porphobilinogen synthase
MTTPANAPFRFYGQEGVNPSRARPAVRNLYTRPAFTAADLSAPLLVFPDGHTGRGGLPGTVVLSDVGRTVTRWGGHGIRGLKLFVLGHDRDARGSAAVAPGNLMVRAIAAAKNAAPQMAVTTEVCGCSWISSGQCVVRTDTGTIDLEATYHLMRRMAVQHGEAGADVVSPTAMVDGSVCAVRAALDSAGLPDIGVNPNLAIHSVLYGPFKTLMDTNPEAGHRRGLQLEAGRADRDTLLQARRWITEGADSLTLQPVMTAVDVLTRLRVDQEAPIVAYSTSGEWAALQTLGDAGIAEYIAMLKRAGADQVLTFAAERVAKYLENQHG